MPDPDEFLDWLEEKRANAEQGVRSEDYAKEDVIQELIDDFNNEFDTRDSPPSPPRGERKKKPQRADFRGPGGGEPCV